jgi:hypothetical protein
VLCFLEHQRSDEAVAAAKEMAKRHGARGETARLLARAYLASGNVFWALRALQPLSGQGDCQALALVAWIHFTQGNLDSADEALSRPPCPGAAAERARWALLRAQIALAREDRPGVARQLALAGDAGEMYPEDRKLWHHLRRRLDPGAVAPLKLRGELGLGFSSNASAGLPINEAQGDMSAAVIQLDLLGRLAFPLATILRPEIELSLRGQVLDDFAERGPGEADAGDGSYLELGVRPAVTYRRGSWQALLGYRAELFVLAAGDPPSIAARGEPYREHFGLYHEGHRAELELGRGRTVVFAGFGRRAFRLVSRSRWEVDGGIGYALPLSERIQLLGALALRYYRAELALYRQVGGTAVLSGRQRLWRGAFYQAGISLGLDYYPNSPSTESLAEEEGARDLLLKARLGVWSPPWHDTRAGLVYEFSWRDSTAVTSFSYDAHRLLLQLRFDLALDPWEPPTVGGRGHLPLPYDLGAAGGELPEERVQDLLRQDETARRGSSCVN